jgi:hypothetical protein
MRRMTRIAFLTLAGAMTVAAAPTAAWRTVAWNNLGMHCMDAEYSVFSILPPYNTLQAQVVDPSGRLITDPAGLTVTYEAVADPSGSINTTSIGKTDFWQHVLALYGASPPDDSGLAGNAMPGAANVPQPMTFDAGRRVFGAEGVPITPYDDAHLKNPYPMMRVVVRDAGGALLASTNVVLPVSDEMDCRTCHGSGSAPAARPAAGWVNDCDSNRDYKLNILRLHDDRQADDPAYAAALALAGYDAAGLYATAAVQGTSVLCARCHASNALPGTGQAGISAMTEAMHGGHAGVTDPVTGQTLDAATNRAACYRCHPGSETRCLRGPMGNSVAADGSLAIQCQECHGSMSRVGAKGRQGWLEEPTCQSCHTGTATSNNGQIRYTSAFDANGEPRLAVNPTFATNPDMPAPGISLYRFSKSHGNLQCEACHGATHAENPSSHVNDNLQSLNLQGHEGTLVECVSCHGSDPATVNGGPHGMHPVGQGWVNRHGDLFESGNASIVDCAACHGTDYRGTVLSRAADHRTLSTDFGTKVFWRGFPVGCFDCHGGPADGDANPNHAPVAAGATANTTAYLPVSVPLAASDADGNPLAFRVVTQPANGTVALSGSTATINPAPGFVGNTSFGFAAGDGSTWSNLATVSLSVGGNFADVPATSTFASVVERIRHAGVTSGCGVSPLVYCPGANVTRAQMAVFLERGMRGSAYVPPAASGLFADVPASSPFAPWIEQLFQDGVTGGCGGGNYCPTAPVTRAQMAVFLTKARHPAGCTYASTGTLFGDVAAAYWAGGFIEQLAREGVTGGCGGGLYCPESTVRRDQMAAFLVKGFRLP